MTSNLTLWTSLFVPAPPTRISLVTVTYTTVRRGIFTVGELVDGAAVGGAAATVTRKIIATAATPIGNRPALKRSVIRVDLIVERVAADVLDGCERAVNFDRLAIGQVW